MVTFDNLYHIIIPYLPQNVYFTSALDITFRGLYAMMSYPITHLHVWI